MEAKHGVKEIKIDNGTWTRYTGITTKVTVSENCTIYARVTDGTDNMKTNDVIISKIDKIPPKEFTATATSTSNSITISGSTTDPEETSMYGSSGIAGYYFSKDNGATWVKNSTLKISSYTFTRLSQGTSYTLKMKAVDNAGNEILTEAIEKTTTSIAGEESITITPSTENWTNADVTVAVTWPSDTTGLTKQIKIGNNSWKTYTGTETISSNCTVQARLIDSTNQTGTVASLTISNIDKTSPTVTAVQSSVIIAVGDSNEISSYFTIASNGTAPLNSIICIDTSNNNTVVTNTNTLSAGTHTITCTVTKETGATEKATITIFADTGLIPASEYGAIVTNYTTPSGDPNVEWRIFYADESNIYLIASDYIHYDYAPTSANYTLYDNGNGYKLSFDDVYQDYTGSENITDTRITKWLSYVSGYPSATGEGIQSVAFMLDIDRWSAKYANTTYAEYAIGVPTIELWCASYKKTHPDKYVEWTVYNQSGYYVKWDADTSYGDFIWGADDYNNLYYRTDDTNCEYMWLASPTAAFKNYLMYVGSDGLRLWIGVNDRNAGLCPLVCLKSDVQLEKQSDGTYLIK